MKLSSDYNFCRSLQAAIAGLRLVYQTERNFRWQLGLAALAVVLGLLFSISRSEWFMILYVSALVLVLEIFNSIVERIVDLMKPRLHPIVRDIKDMMAGAVLAAALVSLMVGCVIFVPRLTLFTIQEYPELLKWLKTVWVK